MSVISLLEDTIDCPSMNAARTKKIPLISIFVANIILDSYHDHKELYKEIGFSVIINCIKDILLVGRNLKQRIDNYLIKNVVDYIKNVIHYNAYSGFLTPIPTLPPTFTFDTSSVPEISAPDCNKTAPATVRLLLMSTLDTSNVLFIVTP